MGGRLGRAERGQWRGSGGGKPETMGEIEGVWGGWGLSGFAPSAAHFNSFSSYTCGSLGPDVCSFVIQAGIIPYMILKSRKCLVIIKLFNIAKVSLSADRNIAKELITCQKPSQIDPSGGTAQSILANTRHPADTFLIFYRLQWSVLLNFLKVQRGKE